MTKSIPLDEQIVASLTEVWPSEQVAAVLASARAELSDLTRRADAADVASLNPLATAAEAKKLRTEGGNHRFDADRMEASVSALEARVTQMEAREQRARREARQAEALKERDELAAVIAREYPRLVATITVLAKRVTENDARLDQAGLRPSEYSAELIGRRLTGWRVQDTPVHRIQDIKIQMPNGPHFSIDTTGIGIPFRWFGLELAEDANL
jgi:hypothetical protein